MLVKSFEAAIPLWAVGDRVFMNPKLVYEEARVDEGDDDVQAVLVVERVT